MMAAKAAFFIGSRAFISSKAFIGSKAFASGAKVIVDFQWLATFHGPVAKRRQNSTVRNMTRKIFPSEMRFVPREDLPERRQIYRRWGKFVPDTI
jgi:hypothetical protein